MMAPIISKAVTDEAIVVQKLDTHTATEQTRDFWTMTIVVTLIIPKMPLLRKVRCSSFTHQALRSIITIAVTLTIFESALASQVFGITRTRTNSN